MSRERVRGMCKAIQDRPLPAPNKRLQLLPARATKATNKSSRTEKMPIAMECQKNEANNGKRGKKCQKR